MKDNGNRIFSIVTLIASVSFYIFFAFYDGAIICVDSPSYIEMSITREFLYSSLLAIFRIFFGEQYLLMVVVFQSVLAAYVAWNITMYIRKEFLGDGYILSVVVLAIPLFVSLLNRFIARRGAMYSNSIMTEGLTISLFLLFFRYLFTYLVHQERKSLVTASILTAILVATRKQMYVALILLFFVIIFVKVTSGERVAKQKGVRWLKGIGKALVVCIAIFLSVTLLDHTYNYLVRGRFVGHTSDNRFVLTMVFYTAEEEYVEELPEEFQPLYLDIYNRCDEQGYLMHSAGKGWNNNVSHFSDSYDLIQINTMWPAIQDYVDANMTDDSTERQLLTDDVTNTMITLLIPKTAPRIMLVLFNNILSGLVTTIAQRNRILTMYSIIAYLGYIGLMLFYRRKAGHTDNVVKLCGLTLLSIIVNVGLVSAVIFCQTRYTIYNMPIFYISGIVLLKSLFDSIKNIKRM